MDYYVDITTAVIVLTGLLAAGLTALVTVQLVPRFQQLWQPLKVKYPTETAFLEAQAVTAINGAEQEFGQGEGALKITAAIAYVKKQAERYGYTFDEFVIKMVIHAKLKEIKDQTASAGMK